MTDYATFTFITILVLSLGSFIGSFLTLKLVKERLKAQDEKLSKEKLQEICEDALIFTLAEADEERWSDYYHEHRATLIGAFKRRLRCQFVELLYQAINDPAAFHQLYGVELPGTMYNLKAEISRQIQNNLKREVIHTTEASFDESFQEKVVNWVEDEKFLDEIVMRLRRKQIK